MKQKLIKLTEEQIKQREKIAYDSGFGAGRRIADFEAKRIYEDKLFQFKMKAIKSTSTYKDLVEALISQGYLL